MQRIIILQDRRLERVMKFQVVQDLIGVAALLPSALANITRGGSMWSAFGGIELIVAAAALVSGVRDMRTRGMRGRIGWLNVLAGALLIAESAIPIAAGGKLFRPSLLAGVAALLLGLNQGRLDAFRTTRRRIVLDDDGVNIRTSPLRTFRVSWSELKAIEVGAAAVTLTATDGRRCTLRLRRYDNAAEICAGLAQAAETRAIAGIAT